MSTALAAAPSSAPVTRRPEKTEKILEAAGQLFREQGYGAVSMDQIARDAGVSKATVYAHFESKERLFAAIVEHGCTTYLEGTVPAVQQLDDMREALTRIARSIENFLLAPKTLGIYRVIIAESPRFPEMRARKPVLAALLDAVAVVANRFLPGKADVRRGDYHVILRKR